MNTNQRQHCVSSSCVYPHCDVMSRQVVRHLVTSTMSCPQPVPPLVTSLNSSIVSFDLIRPSHMLSSSLPLPFTHSDHYRLFVFYTHGVPQVCSTRMVCPKYVLHARRAPSMFYTHGVPQVCFIRKVCPSMFYKHGVPQVCSTRMVCPKYVLHAWCAPSMFYAHCVPQVRSTRMVCPKYVLHAWCAPSMFYTHGVPQVCSTRMVFPKYVLQAWCAPSMFYMHGVPQVCSRSMVCPKYDNFCCAISSDIGRARLILLGHTCYSLGRSPRTATMQKH